MELLVVILVIAVIAAVGYAYMQRRGAGGAGIGRTGVGRSDASPLPPRSRAGASRDPMAAAVYEHANATDPHDAVVAEQRLQAQAGQIAAGMQARAQAPTNGYDPEVGYAGTPSGYSTVPPTTDLHLDDTIDPETGQRTDGYGDPNNDPRLEDSRYEGRIARDYDPNSENPEYR